MRPRVRADLALLFCTAIWGTTFVVVKDALSHASVFLFLALRFALAGVLLAAISRRTLAAEGGAAWRRGGFLGALLFLGFAFQTLGIERTTASKAALITGLAVVLVPLFEGLFFGRAVSRWAWAGAATAFGGLWLLTVPAGEGLGGLETGDLLVGGCAVVFAFHILFVGRYREGHSARALNTVQVAVTAALAAATVPLAHATGWEPARVAWSGGLLAALGITAVGATAVAFTLQVWAQRHTTPSRAALLFSMEPVFAVLTSAVLLGERLGSRALLGGALVLAGILASEFRGAGPVAPESPA